MVRLLICSDIHYASDAEKRRVHYELAAIENPLQRLLVRDYLPEAVSLVSLFWKPITEKV